VEGDNNRLKKIVTVAGTTMLSRVLGLVRDMLTAALLGLTATASAFFFAFTIPNLFRRLLGEGALTSVFIPVLSDELQAHGKSGAFRFANTVLSWLVVVLVGLVGMSVVLLAVVAGWLQTVKDTGLEAEQLEQWRLGCWLGACLMPYMLFICLAAVFSAALNVLERFAVPAFSPVLLNLAMIAALVIAGIGLDLPIDTVVLYLCWGVLLGGVLQLLLPMTALMRLGWRPAVDFSRSQRLQQLLRLFLPGVVGAAVAQVNVLVSRLLAFQLNASAVAALFYANRLVELPLGIFTIAITTVFFPRLSRLASAREEVGLQTVYAQGIRLVLAITVPAMVGLIVLREPILRLLFEWQAFSAADVAETDPLLLCYAAALPFYSLSTFVSRGFHSLQDTRTPVRIAMVAFGVNLVGSLIGMQWLGTLGLALANMLAAIVQSLLLHYALKSKGAHFRAIRYGQAVSRILIAAAVMGLFAWGGAEGMSHFLADGKALQLGVVVVVIPLAVMLYFAVLMLLKFEDMSALLGLLRARRSARAV